MDGKMEHSLTSEKIPTCSALFDRLMSGLCYTVTVHAPCTDMQISRCFPCVAYCKIKYMYTSSGQVQCNVEDYSHLWNSFHFQWCSTSSTIQTPQETLQYSATAMQVSVYKCARQLTQQPSHKSQNTNITQTCQKWKPLQKAKSSTMQSFAPCTILS